MTELIALTAKLEVSRPIFKLQLEYNSRTINARSHAPVYKWTPKPDPNDPLWEHIVSCYRESFHTPSQCFVINREEIARKAMNDIRSSVCKFLEKHLEMKNPKQSKVWRWAYRNMPQTREFEDTLVMLYKYIRTFAHANMTAFQGVNGANNTDHIKNVIIILEALQEKYGGK